MPIRYEDAKIYKLYDDEDYFYIGGTCETLASRKAKHRYASKQEKHKGQKVYKRFGERWDKVRIELVKSCPCKNKDELTKLETDVRRAEKNNPLCLNTIF